MSRDEGEKADRVYTEILWWGVGSWVGGVMGGEVVRCRVRGGKNHPVLW